ncbi:MAG: PD40 domain-containing protein [Steroidobacter sp.]|nr:PD40 domain-containing protein [Steroidobacter sp.]
MQISFETRSGTWVSVDVSPDGRTLLFDLLGDVYRLSIDGGRAEPLITGEAFDASPVFAPDGQSIAFVSDRDGAENLWIAAASGQNLRQLSAERDSVFVSPQWSADGEYIYVTRFNSRSRLDYGVRGELWRYHRLGGGARLDGEIEGRSDSILGASASSDGAHLFFAANRSAGSAYDIYRRDLRTGTSVPLISGIAYVNGVFQPVISPDGSMLAYAADTGRGTQLRLRVLDNGEDRELAFPIETALAAQSPPFQGVLPRYAFTPDSRAIVIAYAGQLRRIDVKTATVQDIAFSATPRLTAQPSPAVSPRETSGPVRARVIQGTQLSPDGRQLAFSAFGKLYVTNLAGGLPRRLTGTALVADGDSENQPTWSADGRWITYASWSRSNGGHLWRVRSDGKGGPIRLTRQAGFYRKPAYTPDGRFIVALRSTTYEQVNLITRRGGGPQRQFAQELVRVPVAGGASELLTYLPPSVGSADHGRLHFLDGGDAVLVHTSKGLLSIPLEGGEPQPLLDVVASRVLEDQRSVDDAQVSPDGRWALVQLNFQLHLLALPPERRGVRIDLDAPTLPHWQLTEIGADEFGWSADGETIFWTVGANFHRQSRREILRRPVSLAVSSETKESMKCLENSLDALEIVVEVARDVPSARLVLRGASVVTMLDRQIIKDADLLIEGNRIAALGPRGSVALPVGTKLLDVTGKTIIPGFIDTHAHYWSVGRQVIDYDSWEYRAALAFGITTSNDPQSFTPDMFVYQDLLDAGVMRGPRAYTTGPGIFGWNHISSERQARCILLRYRDYYRTHSVKSYMVGGRAQRQHMARAANALGMRLISENYGVPRYALTQALDGFAANEHASDAVEYYDDVAQLYARLGTGYSPTTLIGGAAGLPGVNYFLSRTDWLENRKLRRFTPESVLRERLRNVTWLPEDNFIFKRLGASAARISRAGGTLSIGGHSEVQGLGYHWELQAIAMGGLDAHAVLQSATRGSAKALGREADVGTLAPGKLADLLILNSDPLQNLANTEAIEWVMKNGRLYAGETLAEFALP